jgi:hypothetical protein
MYKGNDEICERPLMLKNISIKVRRGIENTEVSTFLLLKFVPFFILLNYYGRSLRIRIMWFDNIFVIFFTRMSRKFRLELV